MIKLNDKIITEVLRHPTAVLRRVTHNHVVLRDYLHSRNIIKSIYDHAGTVSLRKSQPHHASTLCRRHLCPDVIVGKIHLIIIRLHNLRHMREPRGSLLLVKDRLTNLRHEGKHTIIVYPRTRLMRLFQSANLMRSVNILPAITILSGLRSPEIHAPRHCYGRIGVAGRQLKR